MKGVFYEKKYFFKILILISLIFYNQTVFSKDFDIGLSISGWGTGLEGNYFIKMKFILGLHIKLFLGILILLVAL